MNYDPQGRLWHQTDLRDGATTFTYDNGTMCAASAVVARQLATITTHWAARRWRPSRTTGRCKPSTGQRERSRAWVERVPTRKATAPSAPTRYQTTAFDNILLSVPGSDTTWTYVDTGLWGVALTGGAIGTMGAIDGILGAVAEEQNDMLLSINGT